MERTSSWRVAREGTMGTISEDGIFEAGVAEKRGWLYKSGGKVKTWKKRFFELGDKCLSYYSDETTKKYKGCIDLRDVHYVEKGLMEAGPPAKYFFHIRVDRRVYDLCASTATERNEWFFALQGNVQALQRKA